MEIRGIETKVNYSAMRKREMQILTIMGVYLHEPEFFILIPIYDK